MTHKVLFRASLSNGETLVEGAPKIKDDEEGSSWRKLVAYARENGLEITSLCLTTPAGQTFNLPSAGKNPKFKSAQTEAPEEYLVMRKVGADVDMTGKRDVTDFFTVAQADYGDYKLQIWVDEDNPRNSWSLVV